MFCAFIMKSKPSSIVNLIVVLALTAMHGANTVTTGTTAFTSTVASTTEDTNNETSVSSTTNGSTTLVMSTTSEFTTTNEFTTSEPTTAIFTTSQSTTEDFTASDSSTIQFTTSPPTSNDFTANNNFTPTIKQSTVNDVTTSTVLTMTPPTIALTSIITTTTNSNPPDVRSNMKVTIGLSVSLAVVTIAFTIFFVYVRLDRRKRPKDIENEPDDETKSKKSSTVDLEDSSPKRPVSPPEKPDSPHRKIQSPEIREQVFVYDEEKALTATSTTRVDTFAANRMQPSKHCQTDKPGCRSVQNQTDGPVQLTSRKELTKRQTEVFSFAVKPKPATLVSTESQTDTNKTSVREIIDAECQTETMDRITTEEIIVITDQQKDPVKPMKLESNEFKYRRPVVSPKSDRKQPKRIIYSRYNFMYKNILDELLKPRRKTNSLETLLTTQCHCKLPIGKAKWQMRRMAPNL